MMESFLKRAIDHKVWEQLLPVSSVSLFPVITDRCFWGSVPKTERDAIISFAQSHQNYQYLPMAASKALAFTDTGDRKAFEDAYFENRYHLTIFILAECLENTGRFLDQIIDGLWGICEETSWALPAHYFLSDTSARLPDPDGKPLLDLFAGETAQLLATACTVLAPVLNQVTPVICRRIKREALSRVIRPYLEREDYSWMGFDQTAVNNWNPWCNSNCMLAGLLLLDSQEDRKALLCKGLQSLNIFFSSYGDDGGCDEGPGYWSRAAGSLFDALDWMNRATGGGIHGGDSKLKNMANFVRHMAITPGQYINFADARADVNVPADLVYRFGSYLEDTQLMAFAAEVDRRFPRCWDNETKTGISLCREISRLQILAEMRTVTIPAAPSTYLCMDDIELVTARSEALYGKGIVLAVKYGHNAESHNHNDVGSFILYKDGNPVFIDVGVGVYTAKTFSAQRYDIWSMQSNYHNLPIIAGQGQKDGRRHGAHSFQAREDSNGITIQGNIEAAYSLDLLDKWQRRFYLKQGRAEVVLEECWNLSQSCGIEFVFMTCITPKLAPHAASVGGALITCTDERCRVEVDKVLLDDSLLCQSWGSNLFRIRFILEAADLTGKLSFVIQ